MNDDFETRVRDIKVRAHGHWTPLLEALGVDDRILNGRNQPCPMCGGTDRFQYTDKFGEGNYHCRSCGAGGGLTLAQAVLGPRFGELPDKLDALLTKHRDRPVSSRACSSSCENAGSPNRMQASREEPHVEQVAGRPSAAHVAMALGGLRLAPRARPPLAQMDVTHAPYLPPRPNS